MITINPRSLAEELLIINLDQKKRDFAVMNKKYTEVALAGAMLLELILQGVIALRKSEIHVISEKKLEDPLLDKAFSLIKGEEEVFTALYWLREFEYSLGGIKKQYLDRLITKKIIAKKEEKFLWVFPVSKYELIDIQKREQIKQRIQEVVITPDDVDPQTLALMSLIYATDCTGEIFTSKEIEEYIAQIRGMVGGEEIGKSISYTIQMIIDAIMRSYIANPMTAF
ncbi:MAG: GOLPH3/VPS74 family protein [Candidatus Kariarchaeaceae archaeon]